MKRSPVFLLTLVAYTIVILSVTALRTISASTEDGSIIEELSIGVVMLATSIGGAFLAEATMRKRIPAVRLAKEHRNMARRLRAAERAHRRASTYLDRRDHEARNQEDRIARDRARYTATHRLNKEDS